MDKQHAHQLLDQLPPSQLDAVVHLLEAMLSYAEYTECSEEDRRAVAEADEWLAQNEPIPNDEVLADFGLTSADWEAMGREPSK